MTSNPIANVAARRCSALLIVSLCSLFASCSGSDSRVELARGHVRRGNLELAESMLAEDTAGSAEKLRREIAELRAERDKLAAEMETLSFLEPVEERAGLELLLKRTSDAFMIEKLERALSDAADRAASGAGRSRVALRRLTEMRVEQAAREQARRDAEESSTEGMVRPDEVFARSTIPVPVVPKAPASSASNRPPKEPTSEPQSSSAKVAQGASTDSETPSPKAEPQVEVPSTAPASSELAKSLALGQSRLQKASIAQREEAWTLLKDLGDAARAPLALALEARWNAATKSILKSPSFKLLEKVAQDRVELDFRREKALALIFDEEEYFYPYRPPECPPEQARKYWPVQRRVDELVAELREVWESTRTAKLASSLREDIAELNWCLEHASEVALALQLPEDLPAWTLLIPTELKSLGLQEFAWNEAERRQLTNDQTLSAYNESRWEKKAQAEFTESQTAGSEEQVQVRITNEYRRMFGRPVLAWNPKLQESSGGHSDYMARTGNFGHFEEGDETRRSPFDRMRLVGYNYGVSENCHMGGGSAQGAHEGWCKSSGHHRNLLMSGHTEMGSAVSGPYWTQNFGTDKDFRSDIDTWLD